MAKTKYKLSVAQQSWTAQAIREFLVSRKGLLARAHMIDVKLMLDDLASAMEAQVKKHNDGATQEGK